MVWHELFPNTQAWASEEGAGIWKL